MKKKIDMSKISSDLAENSAFFRKPDPLPFQPSSPTSPPSPVTQEKQANKETRKQASPPVEQPKDAVAAPVPFTPEPLQSRPLTRKQTFELTRNELDFMAQAKFELRELGITKNEMVVTGLELLGKDYEANHENSYLYRKFASRKTTEEEA